MAEKDEGLSKEPENALRSRIYEGRVTCSRRLPTTHRSSWKLTWFAVDLDELEERAVQRAPRMVHGVAFAQGVEGIPLAGMDLARHGERVGHGA